MREVGRKMKVPKRCGGDVVRGNKVFIKPLELKDLYYERLCTFQIFWFFGQQGI